MIDSEEHEARQDYSEQLIRNTSLVKKKRDQWKNPLLRREYQHRSEGAMGIQAYGSDYEFERHLS
jgi:hypothetical protein